MKALLFFTIVLIFSGCKKKSQPESHEPAWEHKVFVPDGFCKMDYQKLTRTAPHLVRDNEETIRWKFMLMLVPCDRLKRPIAEVDEFIIYRKSEKGLPPNTSRSEFLKISRETLGSPLGNGAESNKVIFNGQAYDKKTFKPPFFTGLTLFGNSGLDKFAAYQKSTLRLASPDKAESIIYNHSATTSLGETIYRVRAVSSKKEDPRLKEYVRSFVEMNQKE